MPNLHQNPLLGDDDIPSPLFTPRPGWGGMLREWVRENSYLLIFRGVLAVSVALIVISLLQARPLPTAVVTPTPDPLQGVHALIAARGDTLASLAARALTEHLASHPEHAGLTAAHRLFITDTLWRAAQTALGGPSYTLEVGTTVPFPHAALEAVISEAKRLTPNQLAAWQRLVR